MLYNEAYFRKHRQCRKQTYTNTNFNSKAFSYFNEKNFSTADKLYYLTEIKKNKVILKGIVSITCEVNCYINCGTN